jgi:hypothetical protein
MDVGVLRFAVPNGSAAPLSDSCLPQDVRGVVLLEFLTPDPTTCSPTPPMPDSRLLMTFADGDPPATAPNVQVGRFPAWLLAETPIASYRLTDGIEVSVAGADSSQILATFTDSGAVRVLQHGPVVATTGWKTVTIDDVSMQVPLLWGVIDLSHQDVDHGVVPNPGSCSDAWFDGNAPTAFIGESDIAVSCAPPPLADGLQHRLTPENGVWMRDLSTAQAGELGDVIAHGTTNGLDVSVIKRTFPDNETTTPIVDLVVRTASHIVRVSIGVGLDDSIARTILQSLHAS